MTKHIPNLAGALLGLAFIAFGAMFLLDKMPAQEPPPEGSFAALFMGAMVPSGYLRFVKILEILGGLFIAIPFTRRLGMLILVPIVVNIVAFHVFMKEGQGLMDPPILIILALVVFLLLVERRAIGKLIWSGGKAGQN